MKHIDCDENDGFVNKLPVVTAVFWLMKILATTLGETGGDWLSMTMNFGYLVSTIIFFSLFIAAVSFQLGAKKYHPFLYWTVIIATSTAGTTLSDYMDRTLGLGYAAGSAILVSILVALLATWRFSVGTLSVEKVQSRKAELFYWVTILFSNTLGTALGDFLADDSGLGFLGSWLLITGTLCVISSFYFFSQVNKVLLFWLAFILTRPFGATFGDLLTKNPDHGGLGFGTGYSSLILLTILVATILYFRPRNGKVL